MASPTICGSAECAKVLSKVLVCASCRARSYCNKDCQRIDWPFHRQHCSPNFALSRNGKAILAYNRRYRALALTLGLEFLDFAPTFSHLESEDDRRAAFLPLALQSFLHIHLRRVDSPVRGRRQRVSFLRAELATMDRLPAEVREGIQSRLRATERPFPAFTIAYTISDPLDPELAQEMITTFTHGFAWPSPGTKGLGIQKVTRLILLLEWISEMERQQAQRN